jgi:hypothetical protein
MAYQIKKYNGDVLLTLEDGHTDSANSSLTLIGKNVTGFGTSQNENLIHLLENFASDTAPASQIKGQLWYDTSQYKIKVWNGGGWVELAQIDYMGTKPTATRAGQLWFNTATNQLYMNVGTSVSDFRFIGPDLVPGFGLTRLVSTSTKAVEYGANHPVINITVNGEVVGVISTTTFLLDSSNAIEGFVQIKRGITLKNESTTDFQLHGRSTYSNLAATATNVLGGVSGQIPYQISQGITGFINIAPAGQIMVSAGSSTPQYVNTTSISVGYSTTSSNLASGSQGSIAYQTGAGLTSQLSLGTSGYFLTAGTTAPTWSNPTSLSVGQSTTALQANTLKDSASSNYYAASVNASVNTIVQRASDGKIYANTFTGDLVGNVTGVSSIASKLQTARTITLTGATSGSVSFDGSSNVTMSTTAASQFSTGMIVMFTGSSGSVPIGWVICDGSNGTPDLRDRFIVGAGASYAVGSNGGTNSATLTADNLPAHQHNFDAVYALRDDEGPAVYDRNGNRLQAYDGWDDDNDNDSGNPAWYYGKTALSGGAVSPTPITLMPKYYALSFIMKT